MRDENFTQRIDSEYFKKKFLADDFSLEQIGFVRLENIADVKGGKRLPLGETFSDEGVCYIRAEDVKNGFVDWEHSPKISEKVYEQIKRYKTTYNDVLLTIVGNSIGDVGIVKYKLDRCNLTENCVRVVSDKIKPEYLFAYLLSDYGQNTIEREKVGTAQPKLAIERINKFKIPKCSNNFQEKIAVVINLSNEKIIASKQTYKNSHNILLQTLGLSDFQPSKNPVNVKSFSESFGSSGRLDAEYYQIKYEQVVERIKSTNYDRLADIVKIKKSIEPGSANYSEEGLPFVRVSDYDKFGLSTPDKYLTNEFCAENAELIKKIKPKKETILFSKDGSVGTAYMLRKDADFITSGAILYLTVKDKTKIIPEYLTLALNSKLVQMQAERDAGGSIILHWRVSEIENVVVPVIEFDKQREIADLVEESFKLKKQSERLLEVAKKAVEMAIEQDEQTAIDYINKN